ncbi:TatD family hydrolase [Candidatus Puniceispirillum marinum]|uniref:Mg-dependent DNase n=1 Tax=Puniceispirillum marinum (strain IMCC1322) TaxID=488538 RepID=D5BQA4_PUNMI|nr:TatD family hydrolase [Candidatus Puniceispirillum marinum]ADE38602.1 Mg-dependent DNase [Candidatus Puniceispirillum marinum IMCC1322]
MTVNPAIIDSHAHLDYPQFADELPQIIARAGDAGVERIISIGVKLSTADAPRKIAESYDNVWFSVGVHPHEAGREADACNLDAFLDLATHPKCVAIGEAGLDYFYDHAPRDLQAQSFRTQIKAARQLDLPIIVHARDADSDMADIIEDEMNKGVFRGVLHCFSSGAELAQRAVDIGFYVSFSGILTFNKSDELRAIAAEIPADRLLVETDAPFLAPMPHRGKTNEPAYTAHTLARLADIRGQTINKMAAQTYENTLQLFNRMT